MLGEKGDVVVWYHWHSFISEVILLLCVWTAENQRQLVVQLQLWPHHLHTESARSFHLPLFLSLFFIFFFFLSTAFVAFRALSNFLCACLFFFFFFFPRMPDVASTSPILFSTVVSRRLARCSQQLPQHVICLILQSQLRVFSLFYAWRLCVCLLSRGRVVVTQEGNFVQKWQVKLSHWK